MKLLICLFTILEILFLPGQVLAKSYTISSVAFTVYLKQDRSAQVTEKRTYQYNGQFSWADRYFFLRQDQEITDVSLTDETGITYRQLPTQEPGTFYTENQSGGSISNGSTVPKTLPKHSIFPTRLKMFRSGTAISANFIGS